MNIARFAAFVAAAAAATGAEAAGTLEVSGAWIRAAPPGATMLAGYARLRNAGDAPLIVRGARSDAFGDVSLHETVASSGVERMRPLGPLTIAPGQSVALAPGGKHLMLMQPLRPLAAGAAAKIHFDVGGGAGADATFVVREAAPASP